MRAIQAVIALALISLALGIGKYDACRKAYLECDWEFRHFRGKIPKFSVHTKPDKAFTPRVVSKDPKELIGILNTNHVIPEFIRGKDAVPITKFGHPRFTPTHFKPYTIHRRFMASGVGHQTFHGNQKRVARGQCVRIFFTTYQKLAHGHPRVVIDNIHVKREDYKCVVFRLH